MRDLVSVLAICITAFTQNAFCHHHFSPCEVMVSIPIFFLSLSLLTEHECKETKPRWGDSSMGKVLATQA